MGWGIGGERSREIGVELIDLDGVMFCSKLIV